MFTGLTPGTYEVTFLLLGFNAPAHVVEVAAGASDKTGPRCRRRLSATLLAACALWAGLAAEAAAQGSAASDRAVLEAFYDATGGRDWIDDTSWKTPAPLGEWFGVTTDVAGRVTELELPGNGLAGPIPAALGELALLRRLDLGFRWDSEAQQLVENTLTGPIPAELGNLARLERLSLENNALTGPVPSWLGRLTSLRSLALSGNELTGPVPAELGNLANLQWLYLRDNVLTGPVPSWLGRLTNLRRLHLSGNELTGPIPAELGNLVNLGYLYLGYNALTGPVPSSLGRLTSLRRLHLSGNELTGPIPAELGNLTNLEWLELVANALTGPVPSWLGRLTSLRSLDLRWNELTGPIPAELGNLANLEWLYLGSNPLTGSLPQDLTRLSQLRTLDISYTGACAPPTAEFQAWLETIADFRGDTCNRSPESVDTIPPQALTESGPAVSVSMDGYFTDPDDDPLTYTAASGRAGTVTALVSVDTVWLVPGAPGTATVTVTATDPDGLSATQTIAVTVAASAGPRNDREVLEVLYDSTGGESWRNRGNWKTSSPLGDWHGVTTDTAGRVTELDLSGNELAGPIPAALGDLELLQTLNLGGRWDPTSRQQLTNALIGPIPDELGRLENLMHLFLGDNALTGQIPRELRNLVNLRSLSLIWNDLTGPVPAALGRLSNLRALDLGGNELTGPIPAELGNLANLERLSLYWNDLTGPLPAALGRLSNLGSLNLDGNALTGRIPDALSRLSNLGSLNLSRTGLTGPIPAALGRLSNLRRLYFWFSWGLSGPLPGGLESSRLENLSIFGTQTCAPAAWGDWLDTIEFDGRLCEVGPEVTIDVAVVYTPAAREEAGGTAEIEALVDLVIAVSNEAFASSGLQLRLALVDRSEVAYDETGTGGLDLGRLGNPADGFMDEVHALRDRVGADLVSLMVAESNVCGIAGLGGAFSLTVLGCAFTHELGHNMGLLHDRYQVHHNEGGARAHPAYGYVNQRAFEAGAAPRSCWITIMSYGTQCRDAGLAGGGVGRFSNPRQEYRGEPLGVPYTGGGESGVTGPADAAAVLNVTGPVVALWRDRPAGFNRAPTAAGTLPDQKLTLDGTLDVDVSEAFVDPDRDPLTYAVSSSAPGVVTVMAAGARLTLTAVSEGTATIRVTATDPGGLSAVQSFLVTVSPPENRPPETVGTLAALTIGLDEPAATVDVSGAFRDPDGDRLSYGARSSSPSVASVSVLGSQVTVTPLSEGTALVTVTATDTAGSNTTATQTFPVTVGAPANRPPEPAGTLAPLAIGVDEVAVMVELSGAFRDPDGDRLTYGASSSAPGVAAVAVSGSRVTVTAVAEGTALVTVTATDTNGSNTTATQSFAVTVSPPANRPPEVGGTLPPLTIGLGESAVTVEVGGAFRDPDGDALTYGARSSSPSVASVSVLGSRVTVTPLSEGTALVTVTATDTNGSNTAATQSFGVTVVRPFTDHPIVPGETPVRAVHFTELRSRIDGLRVRAGLGRFAWTDPVLRPEVTRVRLVHLLELRSALAEAYSAAGRPAPPWTDEGPAAGTTPIRAAHLMELRAAVRAFE